jgi:predicted dinucleotide-utilizing enzyme
VSQRTSSFRQPHGALQQYGIAALKQDSDLIIASIGTLADPALWESLQNAAKIKNPAELCKERADLLFSP